SSLFSPPDRPRYREFHRSVLRLDWRLAQPDRELRERRCGRRVPEKNSRPPAPAYRRSHRGRWRLRRFPSLLRLLRWRSSCAVVTPTTSKADSSLSRVIAMSVMDGNDLEAVLLQRLSRALRAGRRNQHV